MERYRPLLFVGIFVLSTPISLAADKGDDVQKELKALEGKWKTVAVEAVGKPFPKDSIPDFTFIIAADGKSRGQTPQGEYQATITVDPKKNPKTIDNLHESGAQKGKKQYGIYKLEGDKWAVCMTRPGVAEADRPQDFMTKDTANVVFVFERRSEEEKADKFPAPPKGFAARRNGIERGKLETVEYDSTTVGVKRKAQVYTPPGYATEKKYPVLYLLHGIGGDEKEWTRGGAANVVLDNLYADKKAVPMIVVLPNGRASKDLTARDPIPKQSPAFALFEKDLLNDLIPFIEKSYSVKADREARALAGLSMGGGQSLNFGLSHLDMFAWVGGFSSAPNTRKATDLVKDPADAAKKLRLLWVSCGDRDNLMRISEGFHEALERMQLPHVWHMDSGGHDFNVWKTDLYHFAPLLFR